MVSQSNSWPNVVWFQGTVATSRQYLAHLEWMLFWLKLTLTFPLPWWLRVRSFKDQSCGLFKTKGWMTFFSFEESFFLEGGGGKSFRRVIFWRRFFLGNSNQQTFYALFQKNDQCDLLVIGIGLLAIRVLMRNYIATLTHSNTFYTCIILVTQVVQEP